MPADLMRNIIEATNLHPEMAQKPAVVEAYFANATDVHNHLHQGGLELERHWKTYTWWHRNLATLFGMCKTDAYLAFQYFHPLALNISHKRLYRAPIFLAINILTYKLSFHNTGPSSHLRKHMSVAPTAQLLQTVVAKIMSSHTLKTNMRECPVFQYKHQRLQQDEDGISHNGRVPSVQRKCSVCCERHRITARSYMGRLFLFVTLKAQCLIYIMPGFSR